MFLYNSSIKNNNIAFGVEDENDMIFKKPNQSIDLAHLNDFISKNSEGIEYIVGENGSKLSGGQDSVELQGLSILALKLYFLTSLLQH